MKNFLMTTLLLFVLCCVACKKKTEEATPAVFQGFIMAGHAAHTPESTVDLPAPHGIAQAFDGTLYVTDVEKQAIIKIIPYVGSSTLATGFSNPTGLDVDDFGNLFVADASANKIYKVTPDGTVTVFAGSGYPGFLDGTGINSTFDHPTGITVADNGDLLVTDTYNKAIRKITPEGVVTTYLSAADQLADGVELTEEILDHPYGITERQGVIYVTDLDRVLRITYDRKAFKAYKGNSPFKSAGAITMKYNGNLFVSDLEDHCIRRISTDGDVSVLYGSQQLTLDASHTPLGQCYGLTMNFDTMFATSSSGNIILMSF